MDEVGRSYFDIPTGQAQLFSEKSSQLLAKSGGRSPALLRLASRLFQKVTPDSDSHGQPDSEWHAKPDTCSTIRTSNCTKK